MALVHYSPKLKRLARCNGNCKFGESTPHFDSMAEGESWLADEAKREHGSVPAAKKRKDGKGTTKVEGGASQGARGRLRDPNSWLAAEPETAYRVALTYVDEELGMTVTEHEGELVDVGVFAARSFSGKPAWDKLDGHSCTRFGFVDHSASDDPYGRYDVDVYSSNMIDPSTFWLRDDYSGKEVKGLSERHRGALRDYTLEGYEEMTQYLNEVRIVDAEDVDRYEDIGSIKKHVKAIDGSFATAVGEQRLTYRGINKEDLGIVGEHKLGDAIEFKAFHSSSLEKNIGIAFGKRSNQLILEISSPSGQHIQSLSTEYKYEQEVLLNRDEKYVIVGSHQVTLTNVNGTKPKTSTVVQLVAVNSKGELLDGTNDDPKSSLPAVPRRV